MKAREVIAALKAAGWFEMRTSGSHQQFRHPARPGVVTVPLHGSRDLKIGTLISIERQSGVTLRRR
jgi:predicted RNA binding protein YcfA (HicA-like mRNA interferase family)